MSLPVAAGAVHRRLRISFFFAVMSAALALAFLRRPNGNVSPSCSSWSLFDLPFLPRRSSWRRLRASGPTHIPARPGTGRRRFEETVQRLELLLSTDPARPPDLLVWPESPRRSTNIPDDRDRKARRQVVGHTLLPVRCGCPRFGWTAVELGRIVVARGRRDQPLRQGEPGALRRFVPWPRGYLTRKISTEAATSNRASASW